MNNKVIITANKIPYNVFISIHKHKYYSDVCVSDKCWRASERVCVCVCEYISISFCNGLKCLC